MSILALIKRLDRITESLTVHMAEEDADMTFGIALEGHGVVMENSDRINHPNFPFVTTALGELFIEYLDDQRSQHRNLLKEIHEFAVRHPDWSRMR